jgi:hypothetical protein
MTKQYDTGNIRIFFSTHSEMGQRPCAQNPSSQAESVEYGCTKKFGLMTKFGSLQIRLF